MTSGDDGSTGEEFSDVFFFSFFLRKVQMKMRWDEKETSDWGVTAGEGLVVVAAAAGGCGVMTSTLGVQQSSEENQGIVTETTKVLITADAAFTRS